MEEHTELALRAQKIESLSTKAAEVAAVNAEREAAFAELVDAEAELLSLAVTRVRPALAALSSRILRFSYETGGRNGCNPVSRKEMFEERGVCLINEYGRDKDESGNRGSLGGYCLFLLTDGRFAEVTREGHFSLWQGEADEWTAELAVKSPAEVAGEYDVDLILDALAEKIEQQSAGNASARATANRARAEKVRAVAALLKK